MTTTDKVRGVLLATLIMTSGLALLPLGTSANLTSANVTNQHTIFLGQEGDAEGIVQQSIAVSDLSNDGGETITIDTSEIRDANMSIASASSTTGTVSLVNGNIAWELPSNPSQTETINVNLDTTGGEAENRIRYRLTDADDTSVTAGFKTLFEQETSLDGTGSSATVFSGEVVTFRTANVGDVITVYEQQDGAWVRVDRFSTAPGNAVNYDTTNLEGDYTVTFDDQVPDASDNDQQVEMRVNQLNLQTSAVEANVTTQNNITADVSSADFGSEFTAAIYEAGANFDTAEPVTSVNETFDGTGNARVVFDTLDDIEDAGAGDYVVRVTHLSTGISAATDTINVIEAGEASVSLPVQTISQQRGDVTEFTVTLENTEEAYVQLGGQDSNFLVNFTVEDGRDDDSSVTVSVDTFNSTASSVTDFVSVSDTDSIRVAQGGDGFDAGDQGVYVGNPLRPGSLADPMASGNYNIIVGLNANERDAKTILSLGPPSVDSVNTWVFGGDDLPDSDEMNELLGGLSETDTIAAGDYVVIETQVSGIYAYLNDANDFGSNTSQAFNVYLNLTQQNVGPNAAPETWYGTNATQTYFDAENNTVLTVYQTGQGTLDAGEEYEAVFRVDESNAVYTASQNVSTTFDVVERSLSFTGLNETDVLELEAGPNATVSGTTNFAPGTTVDVILESPRQLFTRTVEVGQNGSFTTTFDLAELEPGSEIDARLTSGTVSSQADAMVVASVQETTTTETTIETTTTETTTTETTTTTTTETTTTTTTTETTTETPTETPTETTTEPEGGDGGIPGFGVGVTLVALVAAALLALRRSR